MIKCLADRALAFKNGAEKAVTKIGFCELPNWVEKDSYYQAAVRHGHIKPFNGTKDITDEQAAEIKTAEEQIRALKGQAEELEVQILERQEKLDDVLNTGNDKVKALKEEIAELEAKRDSLSNKGGKNK